MTRFFAPRFFVHAKSFSVSLFSRIALWLAVSLAAGTAALAAGQSIDLVVPKYALAPGEVITANMIEMKKFSTRSLRHLDVITSQRDLIGMEVRRRLQAGNPVPSGSVMRRRMVRRNEIARIIFQTGALTIIAHVEALDSGGIGDLVRVRNLDSGVIVSGVVDSEGIIRVFE